MGNIITQEVRDKISKKLMGHVDSEETKKRKSLAWLGKTNNPNAQLTERMVCIIKKYHDPKKRNATKIARRLGVTPKSVYDVVNEVSWKHITI